MEYDRNGTDERMPSLKRHSEDLTRAIEAFEEVQINLMEAVCADNQEAIEELDGKVNTAFDKIINWQAFCLEEKAILAKFLLSQIQMDDTALNQKLKFKILELFLSSE